MLPEYVPVIVWPSADMVAWPSSPIEQDDIIPPKPPVGTLILKLTVLPLTVPVITPLPIMLRVVSLMPIVPVRLPPVWVTVQLSVSSPVVSCEPPVQVPVILVDDGVDGADGVLDPQAATASK